jgi:Holliday junction resolvase-like predicted endonuclease
MIDDLMAATRRWVEAEREVETDKLRRLKVLADYFERMRQIEDITKLRFDIGKIAGTEYATVRYFRYEAVQWYEQEKGR